MSSGHRFSIQVCSSASLAAEYSRTRSSFSNTGISHSQEQTPEPGRASFFRAVRSEVAEEIQVTHSLPQVTSLPHARPYSSLASSTQLLCPSGSANMSKLRRLGSRWSSTQSLDIFICMSLLECGTVNGIKVSCFNGEHSVLSKTWSGGMAREVMSYGANVAIK